MRGKVWLYEAMEGWHFVSLPKKQSKEIKDLFGEVLKQGWGSIPVIVTVGNTSWKTSIFPDSKSDTYVLPLKAEVRKKEGIAYGNTLSYSIEIRV